jgi:O-antigen/teichoic acid export membrane protein
MNVIINALWLSVCRIAADASSFLLFAVISRHFGPAGTGDYSYAFAVGTLVSLVAVSGFEEYGIRQYVRLGGTERTRVWANILSTQAAQFCVGGVAFLIYLLALPRPAGSSLAVVLELTVYMVGWALARTFFVPAMAAQSMIKPAITDLSCRFAAIAIALILAWSTHIALPWLLGAFPIAGAVLLWLALRNAKQQGASLRPAGSRRDIVVTLRGTASFAGAEVLNQFYARADILLIAYLLGHEQVGLYATDIKFVEVGLLPLQLLGTASYPLLSRHFAKDHDAFRNAARDFIRTEFFLGCWLAVGIYWLFPLLVVPLFGARFEPAVALLPWIALFTLTKTVEAGLYRVMYAMRRQTTYCVGLLAATVVIVILNYQLIPSMGLTGAVIAGIVSTVAIDIICVAVLWNHVGPAFLPASVARLGIVLALTAAAVAGVRHLGAGPWVVALAGCVLFPIIAILARAVPDPRGSPLFRKASQTEPRDVESTVEEARFARQETLSDV